MRELGQLLWLELKRLGAFIDYILRIFGVAQNSSRFYAIYVAVLLILWFFTAWAYLIEQVEFISREIPSDGVIIVDTAVPILIAIAQWIFLIFVLRESPLKMSAPDLALVATSPIQRGLLAVVYWLKHSALFALLIAIGFTLVSMLLTNITNPQIAGIAGGWSFLISLVFVWVTGAIVWAIALLKLNLPLRRYKRWFWLIPIVILPVIVVFPAPFTYIGQIWLHSINAQVTSIDAVILVLMFVVSTVLLVFSGSMMHLSVVADESQRYARIQRIGLLGQVYARDVIARINRQFQLGSSSRRYFSLPKSSSRFNTLWQRALLSITRLAPTSFLSLLGVGARYTAVIAGLITLFGWQAPQIWLLVAVMLLQFRPTSLIEPFQQTMQLAFIRQFLPLDDIEMIILADSIIPIIVATLGGWLVLVTQTLHIAAFLLVPAGLIVMTLCQALTWFKSATFGGSRIAYEYSTLASGIVIIAAGYFTADLWMALAASLGVIWTLLNLMRGSRL